MILCTGELLADITLNGGDCEMHCGGAPFNVAVNIKRAGGSSAFIGRVGRDPIGKFLTEYAQSAGLDYCDIQTDGERNTTLAFVSLNEGERDFAFFRRDTADYHIEARDGLYDRIKQANIVHLGSLMLNKVEGRRFADFVIKSAKAANKLLSFDINYRSDLFNCADEAVKCFAPYIAAADIIKFSEDELNLFTGERDFKRALNSVAGERKLILVTFGSRGSFYCLDGLKGFVKSEAVKAVDTTGAGDAFFGAALKELDGLSLSGLSDDALVKILTMANRAGALSTLHKGAL